MFFGEIKASVKGESFTAANPGKLQFHDSGSIDDGFDERDFYRHGRIAIPE